VSHKLFSADTWAHSGNNTTGSDDLSDRDIDDI